MIRLKLYDKLDTALMVSELVFGATEYKASNKSLSALSESLWDVYDIQLEIDRIYSENVCYDLEKLKEDPTLLDEFCRIYPQRFHKAAHNLLKNNGELQWSKKGS